MCCACYSPESTDDNDVLMCDFKGCFRAFHMKCLSPAMTLEEFESQFGDEETPWFCPFCCCLDDAIYMVNDFCFGDDGARLSALSAGSGGERAKYCERTL